jgi:hypothetical protein
MALDHAITLEREPPESPFRAAKRHARHLADLAAAESRLAAISGLAMLLLVMFAGAAVIVAWLLIVASLIFLLSTAGVPWVVAAAGFAIVHVALAFAAWLWIKRLSSNLTLPELRHALVGAIDALGGRDGESTLADR